MSAHAPEPNSSARWLFRVVLSLCLGVVLILGLEHWRGVRMLREWKTQVESNSPQKLWPQASESSRQFAAQLKFVTAQLGTLGPYAGVMTGIVPSGGGLARPGSQEPSLKLALNSDTNKTWENLEQAMRVAGPGLRTVRQMMDEIPSGLDYDINEALAKMSQANYVGTRVAAQSLHTAALYELHQRNLPGALEDLLALGHVTKLRAKDPSLVSYMIRIAIVGLVDDAYWDALQSDGWTDQQLAAMQQACQDAPQLSQLPQVFRAEQADRIYSIEWFRSHSYDDWQRRYEDVLVSFGSKRESLRDSKRVHAFKQYVRHPAWRVAWADQELALYLQGTEPEFDAIQNAVRRSSWRALRDDLHDIRARYFGPSSPWRYYRELPLHDSLTPVVNAPASPKNWPYPDFSKAWQVTFRNLTQHNLLLAAIALKRYQLRHGNLPETLLGLCPEFLDKVPLDLMNGHPLRYRVNADNSYTLYSVGLDDHDDDGDPLSPDPSKSEEFDSLSGKDMVWPRKKVSVEPLKATESQPPVEDGGGENATPTEGTSTEFKSSTEGVEQMGD